MNHSTAFVPAWFPRGAAALLVGAALAVGGCASTPRHSALLDEARASYERAQADADVAAQANAELQRAKQLLDTAEAALRGRQGPEQVDHYAYLARQQVQIAEQRAARKVADAKIAASEGERTRIQLSAREREAELARRQAAAAQARAEGAQLIAQQANSDADQARQRAAQLESDLAALEAQRTERGLVVTLGNDVLFDTGRAELKAGASRALDELAKFMQEHPERSVLIEGFTDSVGAEDYNMDLSRRRAEAVRAALLTRGVGADRVASVGYGEQYAIASNADAGGRQLNRRVEVVISDEAGRIAAR
jgi:outer membrane protein OmpA-like peptidoglycan-associated protein